MRIRKSTVIGLLVSAMFLCCSAILSACELQPTVSENIEIILDKADSYTASFTISKPIDWGEFEVMLTEAVISAANETDLKLVNVAVMQNQNFERQHTF